MKEPVQLYKKDTIYDQPLEWFQSNKLKLKQRHTFVLLVHYIDEQTMKISYQIPKKPKNVIMMISDGLGPASITFARMYYQYINDQPYDYQLPIDKIHVGQSRTRSSNTLVTDSAAGATAFSCAQKSYNGAIGGMYPLNSSTYYKLTSLQLALINDLAAHY